MLDLAAEVPLCIFVSRWFGAGEFSAQGISEALSNWLLLHARGNEC